MSDYIHGTESHEQERLSRLNDLLNLESLGMLGLTGGERILDVGSGLGQLSRAMARAAGESGAVVGVERSDEQRSEAVRQATAEGEEDLVDFRAGDAMSLPLADDEWGTFDVAHTRFLLEHVNSPAAVVRSMVRAVRPGGRVVLEDDDHAVLRLWPEPEGFRELWNAYMESYSLLGHDPYVGRRLVSLLHDAGAPPLRNTWLWFGGCAGDELFRPLVRNFIGLLEGARDVILGHHLVSPAALDDGLAALGSWGERQDAALWYARAWAEGRVT